MSDRQWYRTQARACIALARRFREDMELANAFKAKVMPYRAMGELKREIDRLDKLESKLVRARGGWRR